jgi:hypothetical protein
LISFLILKVTLRYLGFHFISHSPNTGFLSQIANKKKLKQDRFEYGLLLIMPLAPILKDLVPTVLLTLSSIDQDESDEDLDESDEDSMSKFYRFHTGK